MLKGATRKSNLSDKLVASRITSLKKSGTAWAIMLVYSGLVTEYLECLKAQVWTTGLRWYDWNKNILRLNIRAYTLTFVLSSSFSAIRVLNIILKAKNSDQDPNGILTYIRTIFMIIPLTISVYTAEMVKHGNVVEQLLMGLASFEHRYCPTGEGIIIFQ